MVEADTSSNNNVLPRQEIILSPAEEQPELTIANYILENYGVKTIRETDQLCLYENGVFRVDENGSIFNEIITPIMKQCEVRKTNDSGDVFMPYHISRYKIAEVKNLMKAETYVSITEFDKDPNRINVKNGHLVLRKNNEGELEWTFFSHFAHNENPYLSLIQLPVYYDADAENLDMDHTISEIVGFEDVPFIYEIFAYCIMPTVKFGKCFLFYGPTRTGKTTLLNILVQFLGRSLIANKSPYTIDKRFQLANTRGKFVNFFDDIAYGKINQKIVGVLKRFATNIYMSGELKGIQGDVEWRHFCKMVISGNETPEVPEKLDDSFWNRWVLVGFYNKFSNDKKDPDLRERKWSDKEKSGLLNKLLEGWIRLEERGGFEDKWNDIERVKELWQLDHNPISSFVKENCRFGEELQVDYELFYKELTRYREEKGGKEVSKNIITRSLKKIKEYIDTKKVNTKAHPHSSGRAYTGIDFKDSYKEEQQLDLDAKDFYIDQVDKF